LQPIDLLSWKLVQKVREVYISEDGVKHILLACMEIKSENEVFNEREKWLHMNKKGILQENIKMY
jgi:hypothetical protein